MIHMEVYYYYMLHFKPCKQAELLSSDFSLSHTHRLFLSPSLFLSISLSDRFGTSFVKNMESAWKLWRNLRLEFASVKSLHNTAKTKPDKEWVHAAHTPPPPTQFTEYIGSSFHFCTGVCRNLFVANAQHSVETFCLSHALCDRHWMTVFNGRVISAGWQEDRWWGHSRMQRLP